MNPRRADSSNGIVPTTGAGVSVKARGRACIHGMILAVCVLWSMADAAAVLTLRTGSHNGVPPFSRTNGRQIASNSKGIWFLAHDGAAGGNPTVFLATSKDSRPEFAGDFTPAMAMAGAPGQAVLTGPFTGARAASLVIDKDDILHLVFQSAEPQGIWYARCPAGGMNPSASLGRREHWTQADGKTPGPERIDQGEGTEFGDLVTDDQRQPWILYSQPVPATGENFYEVRDKGHSYSRRARRPARQLWTASPRDGDWIRRPLTRPGDFGAPAADLDRSGTLHLTTSEKGAQPPLLSPIPPISPRTSTAGTTSPLPLHGFPGPEPDSSATASSAGAGKPWWPGEKVEHQVLYAFFDGDAWTVQGLHSSPEHFHHPHFSFEINTT